jgi:hypothetical protein
VAFAIHLRSSRLPTVPNRYSQSGQRISTTRCACAHLCPQFGQRSTGISTNRTPTLVRPERVLKDPDRPLWSYSTPSEASSRRLRGVRPRRSGGRHRCLSRSIHPGRTGHTLPVDGTNPFSTVWTGSARLQFRRREHPDVVLGEVPSTVLTRRHGEWSSPGERVGLVPRRRGGLCPVPTLRYRASLSSVYSWPSTPIGS